MGSDFERAFNVLDLGKQGTSGENNYLALSQIGDTNVSPMPWSWRLLAYGWEYQIVGKACEDAASAESGMLKPHGKWVKAETYIGYWRKAIKEAKVFEDFCKLTKIKATLSMREGFVASLRDYSRRAYIELCDKYPDAHKERKEDTSWLSCVCGSDGGNKDETIIEWNMTLDTHEKVKDFFHLKSLAKGKIYLNDVKVTPK